MTRGSILLVSYHFYPSPEVGAKRPSETALSLIRNGYEVTVLRAWDRSFSRLPSPEALRGMEIVSVTIPKRLITAMWIKLKGLVKGRDSVQSAMPMWSTEGQSTGTSKPKMTLFGWMRRQLLAYDTLFQGNKRWLILSVLKLYARFGRKRFDLVIASGPPMVSYICGWIAARLWNAKLILDYRDPWYLHGDKELSTVMLGHPLANFENELGRKCAARCAAIVAASPGTKRHILERFGIPGERVRLVRNGFDEHAVISEAAPHGSLEMLYAGSLYWNRNPFPFMEALHDALVDGEVSRTKIHLRLVGDCETWKGIPLAPWVAERGMQDVIEILPFLSPAELRNVVAKSNLLINFAQGQQRQIPAKSYEYIAAQRDVLVVAEHGSDVADLFREAGVGTIVEPGDSAGFRRAIVEMYAKHVAAEGQQRPATVDIRPYSRTAQLERFLAVVEEVLPERPAAPSP